MAIYPCTFDSHRYPQPQQAAYATHVAGSRPETRKARLCPAHFAVVADFCEGRLTSVDVALQSSLVCESCEEPTTEHVFVTLYEAGRQPTHWCGDFCAVHAEARLAALRWSEWVPRT